MPIEQKKTIDYSVLGWLFSTNLNYVLQTEKFANLKRT